MLYGAGPVATPCSVSAMSFSARAQKFPDKPGARPANSLEVSGTKKHKNFLEKNPVKTGENYSFDSGSLMRWTDRRSRGSAGTYDAGSVTSPAPEWDAESDVGHNRVGSGSKAIRGYVQEEPVAQCEGTCACNCNNPLSAVVTVYGHQRHLQRCCCYDAAIQYKPQRCQRQ